MSEKHRGALSVFLKTPHHLQPLFLTVCLKRFFLKAVCQLPTVSWDDRAVNFQTGVMTPRTRLLPTAGQLPKGRNITIVIRVCRATKFFWGKKQKQVELKPQRKVARYVLLTCSNSREGQWRRVSRAAIVNASESKEEANYD